MYFRSDSEYLSALDETRWLKYISELIKVSSKVCTALHRDHLLLSVMRLVGTVPLRSVNFAINNNAIFNCVCRLCRWHN